MEMQTTLTPNKGSPDSELGEMGDVRHEGFKSAEANVLLRTEDAKIISSVDDRDDCLAHT